MNFLGILGIAFIVCIVLCAVAIWVSMRNPAHNEELNNEKQYE
jgi:hypothetical protein